MELKYSDFYNQIIENAIALGKPVTGFFELTSRCNLRCKMCYVCGDDNKSLMDKELTTEQWIELGKQARDAGVLFITLTGGEIFIRKDFWKIYEAFSQMGFIIRLYTNATLINDDIVQRLTKIPPALVSITVYGACPDTYGKVTGYPEAYEKTVTNIKKMKDAGISVQLKTTVIKYNSGEFQQLAELSLSMGLNIGLVNYISPRREGTSTDPLGNRLEPLELARYEKNANECIMLLKNINRSHNSKKDNSLIVNDVMSDEHIENYRKEAVKVFVRKTAFRCIAATCGFWLSWEGKMFPCGLLSEVYSEPMKRGFEEAWNDIKEKIRNIPLCQECESCSYYSKCMTCPTRRKLETGSYDKPAPYLCEYTKSRDVLYSSR